VLFVDALPTTSNGKVAKAQVRHFARAEVARTERSPDG
jgi:acyl-coenzyme A synthetase/AMP-(fatty) acid ligase